MFKLFILISICFVIISARPTKEQVRLLLKRIRDFHGDAKYIRPMKQFYEWRKHDLKLNMTGESGLVCGAGATGCDNPDIRDGFKEGGEIRVRIAVTIVNDDDGVGPDGPFGEPLTAQDIYDQMAQLEIDFEGTNLRFDLDPSNIYFPKSSAFTVLSPYGETDDWAFELAALKDQFAFSPKTHLNVFVTGQEESIYGTLLGIGTFPWDDESITSQGGLWVNSAFFGKGQKTAAHELGHNIGLWHSFQGVSGVTCNDPCFEEPHEHGDRSAAYVGDFIETTQASPVNYYCQAPTSRVCGISNWQNVASDWENYMSYTPDSCMASFQAEQGWRGRCYLCTSQITSQVENLAACPRKTL